MVLEPYYLLDLGRSLILSLGYVLNSLVTKTSLTCLADLLDESKPTLLNQDRDSSMSRLSKYFSSSFRLS